MGAEWEKFYEGYDHEKSSPNGKKVLLWNHHKAFQWHGGEILYPLIRFSFNLTFLTPSLKMTSYVTDHYKCLILLHCFFYLTNSFPQNLKNINPLTNPRYTVYHWLVCRLKDHMPEWPLIFSNFFYTLLWFKAEEVRKTRLNTLVLLFSLLTCFLHRNFIKRSQLLTKGQLFPTSSGF